MYPPHVGFERAVRAGDGGATGETRHPVPGHGQRVWLRVGADPHAGEGGGHPRHAHAGVGRQTSVARLVVSRVAGARVSVTEGAVARVEGEAGEHGAWKQRDAYLPGVEM